jgi:hypothetical protein
MSSSQAIIKEESPVVHVLAIYLLNHGSFLFLAFPLPVPPTNPADKPRLSRRTKVLHAIREIPTTPLCSLDEPSRVSGPIHFMCAGQALYL